MNGDLQNQVEPLFSAALAVPEAARQRWLDAAGVESTLRARVESLLSAFDCSGDFLATPLLAVDETGFLLAGETADAVPAGATRLDRSESGANSTLPFLAPPLTAEELGRFRGYRVLELLGRGGAGIALKAHDEQLDRIVALKVLAPEWSAQGEARLRFLREARAAAAVQDPHVVAIYAIDDAGDPPCLAMECVAGASLGEWIRGRSLPVDEVLRIGAQVARGLAAAHAQRLVHRDIKPANILVEQATGHVKLTDFGLARAVDDARLTQEGTIAGTPQYMSPEQARGEPVDARTDLFSLGCVLYELCAGRPPFRSDSSMAVLKRICEESPRPLAEFRQDLPRGLTQLIDQLLRKDRRRRPASAVEVCQRLEGLREGRIPAALRRRVGWTAAAVAAPLAVAFGFAALGFVPSLRLPSRSPEPAPLAERPPLAAPDRGPAAPPQESAAAGRPEEAPLEAVETPSRTAPAEAARLGAAAAPLTEFRQMSVDDRLYGLAVSPSGDRIYAGGADRLIHVWDARTGGELLRLSHSSPPQSFAISPDGTRLAAGGVRWLRIWNTESGVEVAARELPWPLHSLAFSPSGAELVVSFFGVAGRADAGLRVCDVNTAADLRALPAPDGAALSAVDWSPFGDAIAAGSRDGRAFVLDAETGAARREWRVSAVPGPAFDVRFSANGERLYAAGSGNVLRCWSLSDGAEVFARRFSRGVVRFVVSEDERWLAMGGGLELRVCSLNPSAGDTLLRLEGHTSPIFAAAFVPGADVVATTGWDGTVRLWRLPNVAQEP